MDDGFMFGEPDYYGGDFHDGSWSPEPTGVLKPSARANSDLNISGIPRWRGSAQDDLKSTPLTRRSMSSNNLEIQKPSSSVLTRLKEKASVSQETGLGDKHASPKRRAKNRCYVGFTVDPNRRIRQHNGGRVKGGAKKTDNRGPWDMVCIVHGFPNAVSALRFEWAWQNPDKSRRLSALKLKKTSKETPFGFRLRIACHLMNSPPWTKLALTFRWLIPEAETAFPRDIRPPHHVVIEYGLVKKTQTVVPSLDEEYEKRKPCAICKQEIKELPQLLRCLRFETCGSHFHVTCLARQALTDRSELNKSLFPMSASCSRCSKAFLWGDLVRDQRMLVAVSEAANDDLKGLVLKKARGSD